MQRGWIILALCVFGAFFGPMTGQEISFLNLFSAFGAGLAAGALYIGQKTGALKKKAARK